MPLFNRTGTGNRYEKETTTRTFTGETPVLQTTQPVFQQVQTQVLMEPVQIQEKPVVVHERIRKEEVEEIQPIIHREHEKLEVHQVTQPMIEQIVQPTIFQDRALASETRPIISKGSYIASTAIAQGTQDIQSFHKVVEKSPIIMETERKRVLEEIQPVIYKEILQPTIIRETKDIYEKVIEAPIIIQETRTSQFIGRSLPSPPVMASYQTVPSSVQQRETVDRWVEGPAPLRSVRV